MVGRELAPQWGELKEKVKKATKPGKLYGQGQKSWQPVGRLFTASMATEPVFYTGCNDDPAASPCLTDILVVFDVSPYFAMREWAVS
jgi:hypothetical protein